MTAARLAPHEANLLLISPPVDLTRDNGVSLPLRALLRHLPEHGYRVAWHALGGNQLHPGTDTAALLVPPGSALRTLGIGLRRVRPAASLRTLRSLSVRLPVDELGWDPARDVVLSYLVHGVELALATPARRHALVAQDVLAELTARRADVEPSPLRRAALRINARAFGRYERFAYRRSRPVTVVSDHESQLALARYGVTPSILPNGIALPDRAVLGAPLRPTALLLGDFGSPRNALAARQAVEALPRLLDEEGVAVGLCLVGPRPPADLVDAAGRSGVEVLGYVDDLSPVLAGASAMLALHPVATGIKNSVLTAVAHGLPCLVSEQVALGLPAILRDVVEVTDLEGAATILARLTGDPQERMAWGRRTRAAAEAHGDWRAYAGRIAALLA